MTDRNDPSIREDEAAEIKELEKDDSNIYRQSSFERKNHPEQLDKLLEVVNPASWVAITGVFVILAMVMLWSFFGSLPINTQGRGIFIAQDGAVTIQTKIKGIVKKIYVTAGSSIQKNALIAEIFDPQQELMLEAAETKVETLTRNLSRLKHDVAIEGQAIKSGIQSELKAKDYTIKQKEKNLDSLKLDFDKKKELFKEGLISANTLREQETRISQENIEIETVRAAAENLKASLLKGYRKEEIVQSEQELFKAQAERDLLQTTLEASRIYSPINGKVLEIFVKVGDLLTPGRAVIWIETPLTKQNPLVVYGYFPLKEGKNLVKNQRVEVILPDYRIQGKIAEISQYPVSSEQLLNIFHSKNLADYLTSSASAVLYTLITLERDVKGNFLKSGGSISTSKISTGTVCELQGVVSEVRPIYYLLPLEQFKKEPTNE